MCEAEYAYTRVHTRERHTLKADYVKKKKHFSKLIPRAKRCHWKQSLDDLLTSHKHGPSDFWRSIGKMGTRNIKSAAPPMEVLLENGNTSTELKTVLSTWKHNYENLLNPERHSSNEVEHDNPLTPENVVNQPDTTTPLIRDISLKEVAEAVGKTCPGKAVGIDQIPSETLKNPTVTCVLHDLFVRCFHLMRVSRQKTGQNQ